MRKVSFFVLPLILFVGLAIFLFQGLFSDPREHESTLLNKPVPSFVLPDLMNTDLTYTTEIFVGKVTLLSLIHI